MESLLTIEQAAPRLGLSPRSLANLVTAGSVQHTRIGRRVRFSAEDLAAIVAAGRRRPTTVPTRDEVSARRAAGPRRRRTA